MTLTPYLQSLLDVCDDVPALEQLLDRRCAAGWLLLTVRRLPDGRLQASHQRLTGG